MSRPDSTPARNSRGGDGPPSQWDWSWLTRYATQRAAEVLSAWNIRGMRADEIAQDAIDALWEAASRSDDLARVRWPARWLRGTVRRRVLLLLRARDTAERHAPTLAEEQRIRRLIAPDLLPGLLPTPANPIWQSLSDANRRLVTLFERNGDVGTVATLMSLTLPVALARFKWIVWRHAAPRGDWSDVPLLARVRRLRRAGFTLGECASVLDVGRECLKKRLGRACRDH